MKKLFVLTLVVILTLGFTSTLSAASPWNNRANCICAAEGFSGCPFRDERGNFLTRSTVVENLDALVQEGTISQAARDLWLERFDAGLGAGFGLCRGAGFCQGLGLGLGNGNQGAARGAGFGRNRCR